MLEKFKKGLSLILISALLLIYGLQPVVIFAEEEITPTPTPIPIESEVTPTPTESEVTPTPEPLINSTSDSPITPADSTIDNSADVSINIDSSASSSGNTIATPSAIPTPTESDPNPELGLQSDASQNSAPAEQPATSSAEISTSDAISTVNIENAINTTSINSETLYQTINIYVTQTGDIDMSDPITIAVQALSERTDDPVINVALTGVHNFAYLANDVTSISNTGDNSINSPNANGSIVTGNAYSAVSILNKVNFVVINSKVHVVTINIYGNLNGNIILPNLQSSQNCQTCGVSLMVGNNANLQTNVDSNATTGLNSITASGSANITSGNALSAVNNINIVNSNYLGVVAQGLYITTFGTWNGNFIGWDGFTAIPGNQSLSLASTHGGGTGTNCNSCIGNLEIENDAIVLNNILSSSNTGKNSINGNNANIISGNAYSIVSLINFINSNFIDSIGFFGFINIFGNLNGDIGGKNEFDALKVDDESPTTPVPNQTTITTDQTNPNSESGKRETGGKLEVENTNNVGEYVKPGDTVTFFIKVKNIGTRKIYDTKLYLYLIKNGVDVGGTTFDLGTIDAQKITKVSTGFVLSLKTPPGEYIARAYVEAIEGENNKISSYKDSQFRVFGNSSLLTLGRNINKEQPAVLGTGNFNPKATTKNMDTKYLSLLALSILGYFLIKALRKKQYLIYVARKRMPLKLKIYALRMFLL